MGDSSKNNVSIEELQRVNQQLTQVNEDAIRLAKLMTWGIDFDVVPEGNRFYANDLLIDKIGLEAGHDGLFSFDDLAKSGYPDEEGQKGIEKMFTLFQECVENARDEYTVIVKHKNNITGDVLYIEHNAKVVSRYNNGQLHIVNGYNVDISERVFAQHKNEYLINHDHMTGLKNRYAFEKYISTIKDKQSYTVVMADIDGLKFLNDAFGHPKGDEAIKLVAQSLVEILDVESEIFRIGGDEFTIITPTIDEKEILECLENVKQTIEKKKLETGIALSISIGYEIKSDNSRTLSQLLSEAENSMYRQKLNNRNSRKSKSLDVVTETLNQKTEETYDHCSRMASNAIKLMKRIGYSRQQDFDDMKLATKIHDIGKITIPLEILNKPSSLTEEEYTLIQKHSEAGYKITKNIVDSDRIALAVLHHHEREDGAGYPFGIKGNQISSFAKILSIVDAFDAMTTNRCYSKAVTKVEAIEEIKRCAGKQFDSNYAREFVKILEQSS